jgi:hypothetical protein
MILYIVAILTYNFMTADVLTAIEISGWGVENVDEVVAQMRSTTIIGLTMMSLLATFVACCLAVMYVGTFHPQTAGSNQILSLIMWGEVVHAAGLIVEMPIICATGVDYSFSMHSLLRLIAPGCDQGMRHSMLILLRSINLFLILEVVFVGIGFANILGVPRIKGYLASVVSLTIIQLGWIVCHLLVEA